MARKSNDDRPARIWTFALPLGPTIECRETVERQFQLAADYYRTLIEIEIERLRRYRVARAARFPALANAEQLQRDAEATLALKKEMASKEERAELEELVKVSRKNVKDVRSNIDKESLLDFNEGTSFRALRLQKLSEPAAELAQVEETLANVILEDKKTGRQNSSKKRAAVAAKEAALSALSDSELSSDEWAAIQIKRARAIHGPNGLGLCVGTYMLVESRVQQSIRMRRKQGLDPEVKRWFGEGVIGVQIQGGRSPDQILSNDSQIRISQMPGWAEKFKTLHMKGPGMWMRFQLLLHRDLPPQAHIAGAYVSRELAPRLRDSRPRYKYKLCLILRAAVFAVPVTPKATLACGINFGFRHLPEGPYRHAYLVDSNGHTESLDLPDNILNDFRRADGVRSARDTARDTFQAWAVVSLKDVLPNGFHQWRSCDRMEDFARKLANAGTHAEHEATLRAYDRQSRHLDEYERGLRDQTVRRRDEHYRLVARRIAKQYTYVFVDDQSMDEIKLHQEVPYGMGEARDLAARQFQYVAPGYFRNALVLMTGNCGSIYQTIDCVNISRICHVCQTLCDDPHWKLNVTCQNAHTSDVDKRAASNVLARGLVPAEGPTLLPKEKTEPSDMVGAAE